jgi:hypothetical protein
MIEDDPLDPELVSSLENVAGHYGFKHFTRPSKNSIVIYRNPARSDQKQVEKSLSEIIHRFGMRVKFEWSMSNWQRLLMSIVEPAEYERVIVVRGKIGATIGGRTQVYVKGSDNEELYVTPEGDDQYMECDATELPEGVKIYYGSPVMIDTANRVIVAPANFK